MKVLGLKRMLRDIQDEINRLKKIDLGEIDSKELNMYIQRSKAIAYLISVGLNVYEKLELERELEEIREMVEGEKRDQEIEA